MHKPMGEKPLWTGTLKAKKVKHPMRWVFWTLAALFFFYEYILRVQPSVIVPELMGAFNVNATAIGSLSAFYFYIYGPMQLPVGVMTDRYGARRLLAIAAAVLGLGSLVFAIATNFWMAALARFLMGGGSSFGFVGLVYICSHWFVEKHRGILIGLGNTIGTIGAVFGEGPLRKMVNIYSWRPVSFFLAIVGFALAVTIALAVRNAPSSMDQYDSQVKKEPPHILKNLFIVCRNPYTWIVSLCSLFFFIFSPGFAALWGIPFIHTAYGYSIEKAGFVVSMVFVGWAIGSPIIGRLSDHFQSKKLFLIVGGLVGACLASIVVFVPNIPLLGLYAICTSLGIVSSTQLLTYSYAIDINPESTKGTAVAFANFMAIVGAALIQPLFGYILDNFWSGKMLNGIRYYSSSEYRTAMILFPIFFLLSSLFAIFLKKSSTIKES